MTKSMAQAIVIFYNSRNNGSSYGGYFQYAGTGEYAPETLEVIKQLKEQGYIRSTGRKNTLTAKGQNWIDTTGKKEWGL